jgi:hypothetical protein
VEQITELRLPEHGHGEPKVERLSVSPTWGRAFLGCPHSKEEEELFVYEVHVEDPVQTTDTADHEITKKHLITPSVLAQHSGRIWLACSDEFWCQSDSKVSFRGHSLIGIWA